MHDLGRTEQPKYSIPVRRMGDIAREQRHGRWQLDPSTPGMYLRVQDIHYSDVVTSFDETAHERRPDESRPTGDEHGCCQEPSLRVIPRNEVHSVARAQERGPH